MNEEQLQKNMSQMRANERLLLSTDAKRRIRKNLLQLIDAEDSVRRPANFFVRHRLSFAASLAVAVLMAGTSFAAESALPGSPLYGVKRNVNETMSGLLATTPEARASHQVVLAARRIEEGARLARNNKLNDAVQDDLRKEISTHLQLAYQEIITAQKTGRLLQAAETAGEIAGTMRANDRVLGAITGPDTSSTSNLQLIKNDLQNVLGQLQDIRDSLRVDVLAQEDSSQTQLAASRRINQARKDTQGDKLFLDTPKIHRSRALKVLSEAVNAQSEGMLGDALNLADDVRSRVREAKEINKLTKSIGILSTDIPLEGDGLDDAIATSTPTSTVQ